MATYLGTDLMTGKWYISEGWLATNHPNPEEVQEQLRQNQRLDRMVIAGPFDSKKEAKADFPKHSGAYHPLVWQR